MGILVRQSILTSIISYLGVGIGYVNLLYLYPKFLEPEQVGLLRTLQDAAMLFTPFAIFGLGQSIIKFFPYFASDVRQTRSFITLILTLAMITYGSFLFIFLIFEDFFISFFKSNAPNILQHTPLILWLTGILVFITLLEQYSRSLLNVAFPSFVREVGIRLMQGILVSLFFLHWITFDQFLMLSVVLFLIALLIVLAKLLLQGQLTLSLGYLSMPRAKLKAILTFSSLSFIGASSMILIGKMDSVMVSGMLGLASNAVYTTAFYMATVIEVPKRAIISTATPMIARAFEKNDLEHIRAIYRKTSINQLIIGALLLIGIWANLPNLFSVMPKGDFYEAGAFVVVVVGCGKLLDMLFGAGSEIIGLSPHYWFNLVAIAVLAVVVVISNYLLIPRFGIEGAAYGTALALTVYNLSQFIFIYFRFGLQPFSIHTAKVILISIVVMVLNKILPRLEPVLLDMIVRSGLITVVFGTLVLTTKSSEEVNKVFSRGLQYLKIRGAGKEK